MSKRFMFRRSARPASPCAGRSSSGHCKAPHCVCHLLLCRDQELLGSRLGLLYLLCAAGAPPVGLSCMCISLASDSPFWQLTMADRDRYLSMRRGCAHHGQVSCWKQATTCTAVHVVEPARHALRRRSVSSKATAMWFGTAAEVPRSAVNLYARATRQAEVMRWPKHAL